MISKLIFIIHLLFISISNAQVLNCETLFKTNVVELKKESVLSDSYLINSTKIIKNEQLTIDDYIANIKLDMNLLSSKKKPADILARLQKLNDFEIQENGYLAGLTPNLAGQETVEALFYDMANHNESRFNETLSRLPEIEKKFYIYNGAVYRGEKMLDNHLRNVLQFLMVIEVQGVKFGTSSYKEKIHLRIEEILLFKYFVDSILNDYENQKPVKLFKILKLNKVILQDEIFWLNLKDIQKLLNTQIKSLLN